MATHSSTLAWRIPWTESLAGYSLWGHKESDVTEVTTHARTHAHTHIQTEVEWWLPRSWGTEEWGSCLTCIEP